jgi:hypothetical protein
VHAVLSDGNAQIPAGGWNRKMVHAVGFFKESGELRGLGLAGIARRDVGQRSFALGSYEIGPKDEDARFAAEAQAGECVAFELLLNQIGERF